MTNVAMNINGLSAEEVSARIQNGEVNTTQKFTTRTIPDILKNNIFTVFNTIIILSVIALILIHAYIDSLFLLAVAFFNTLLGIVEEIRAKIALDRLALLKHNRVKVIRSGMREEIPVENVVKDEVIFFERGDQIIADGVLISTSPVAIDESLLTGEARASEKHQNDKLLSGSFCVAGGGIYVATAVGPQAYINTLAAMAKSYKSNKTPLQQDINTLIEILTVIMVLFSILLLIFNLVKNVSLANIFYLLLQ